MQLRRVLRDMLRGLHETIPQTPAHAQRGTPAS